MVFCSECGFNCQDGFKFCPSCGTKTVATSGQQPSGTSSSEGARSEGTFKAGSATNSAGNRPFLDKLHEPTDEFRKYADAIFDALDATVEPKKTGYLELPKLVHHDKICSDIGSVFWEEQSVSQDEALGVFQGLGCEACMRPAQGTAGGKLAALTRRGYHRYLLLFIRINSAEDASRKFGRWLKYLPIDLPAVELSMLPGHDNGIKQFVERAVTDAIAVPRAAHQRQAEETLQVAQQQYQFQQRALQNRMLSAQQTMMNMFDSPNVVYHRYY